MKNIFNSKNFNYLSSALMLGSGIQAVSAQQDAVQPFKGVIGKTLKESTQSWPDRLKAKAGSPNVVYILIDDVGYGASSSFGGLIPTPNLDNLANNGLRYTNFHTTAISSPTRSALLTGRNHHSVHAGENSGAGTPGYDRAYPLEKAFAGEILRENGYNTYGVGKWHMTPTVDQTQAGPFNRWPTGRGFDHFFGFFAASTDQWHPLLIEDNFKVEKKDDNDQKLLTTLITDKAISYVAEQKSIAPEKPFFLYYAPGATHAPHQTTKEWIAKFKGQFDEGWDVYREKVLARQKQLGVVPQYVQLQETNYGVKKWADLSADEKKVNIRFFETYAAFLAQTDYEIGRFVNYLKEIGQFDNTLIFVSIGDNGASKEGNVTGTSGLAIDPSLSDADKFKETLKNIDLFGTDKSSENYPQGWAQAANTPFKYLKQDANAEGGTHNPLIVSWPNGIKDKGGIRNQFTHVIDILPTTIQLIGAKTPDYIKGYRQEPLEGTSFAYTLDNPTLPSNHSVQYFEIKGSRAIYKNGWKAGAYHVAGTDFGKDKWELYKLDEDFNESTDLAQKNPDKLKELLDTWEVEATKYNVYPLKDNTETPRTSERNPNLPQRKHFVYYGGISQIVTDGPSLSNNSYTVAANVEIPAKGAEGVLFSNGGHFGGISLFIQNKKLQVVYNLGYKQYSIVSNQALPTGTSELKINFDFESAEKGGVLSLYSNGKKVGETHIEKLDRGRASEGFSVGRDILTPVSSLYKMPFAFTGTIKNVTIDIK